MKKEKLRVLVLSDIHLGHRKSKTEHICQSLTKYITYDRLRKTDIFFIPGDLFDRHLSLSSQEVFEIHSTLTYILQLCKKTDVCIRVLEGTPSHDWRQSKLLESINETGIGADLRYVPQLEIEHIDSLGIDVLYIPDEWDADPLNTQVQVEQLMRERSIEKVDFSIMHGQFEFQLPEHVQAPKHDSHFYSSITRHYVFIGHVHIPIHRGNIIAPGSFDRLAHGEEHPKGLWYLEIDPKNSDRIDFIENKEAVRYISIDLSSLDIDQAIEYIDSILKDVPSGSHVRFIADKNDSIAGYIDSLKRKYSQFQCTHKLQGSLSRSLEAIEDMRARSNAVAITRESVVDLVSEKMDQLTDDTQLKQLALYHLEEHRHEPASTAG